jgi:hypothetical protein
MRKFVLLLIFLSASFLLKAQAYIDNTEYNKEKQECIVMEYDYPPEAVENALRSKLAKMGYKGNEEKGMFNKDKGFRVYKESVIGDISPSKYDYVINIVRKSKKERDATVLYLIIFKDKTNALSRLTAEELGKTKSFLYNLLPEVEEANLELLITAQLAIAGKAEKRLKDLQDNRSEIEKKIKKLQEDLEKNAKEQEDQQKEIENQHKALEALKGKRKASI